MGIWVLRIVFMAMCTMGGFAISQVRPELLDAGRWWALIGFGLGGVLIAIDEMLKGFSLRAFSSATFGLLLGTIVAQIFDKSGLFVWAEDETKWVIRLGLFIAFGYIGMILAMRSNKEDFSLIIPYVRFSSQSRPENLLLLDTSAIIDGRVAELLEGHFLEGIVVVPRFVLKELQQVADSDDPIKRARGRRGLDTLNRVQRNPRNEVKIHEGDFPEEAEVDAKLIRLAHNLGSHAKLITSDYNLGRIAELQSVKTLILAELANAMKPVILPGESIHLKIVREGKDKGQGVGYLGDGTMVVVNGAHGLVGQQVEAQVISILQSGSGVIVFTDLRSPAHAELKL
jgi:uncharacterized protein YacL